MPFKSNLPWTRPPSACGARGKAMFFLPLPGTGDAGSADLNGYSTNLQPLRSRMKHPIKDCCCMRCAPKGQATVSFQTQSQQIFVFISHNTDNTVTWESKKSWPYVMAGRIALQRSKHKVCLWLCQVLSRGCAAVRRFWTDFRWFGSFELEEYIFLPMLDFFEWS